MKTTDRRIRAALLLAPLLALGGCASGGSSSAPGYLAAQYVDPSSAVQGVSGIGFESQDVREMTDRMVRDILANPMFGNSATPARVIIDNSRFVNESSQTLNVNLLMDRLRIELMRASQGRILFVSRQNVDLVEKEKQLKAGGQADAGLGSVGRAIAGADYQLIGKITSQNTAGTQNGVRSNYFQFSFEMLDLNNGLSVWGNLYDVKKAGADDQIYR